MTVRPGVGEGPQRETARAPTGGSTGGRRGFGPFQADRRPTHDTMVVLTATKVPFAFQAQAVLTSEGFIRSEWIFWRAKTKGAGSAINVNFDRHKSWLLLGTGSRSTRPHCSQASIRANLEINLTGRNRHV